MSTRAFFTRLVLVIALVQLAAAAACGDDDDDPTESSCLTLDPIVDIIDNHATGGGHALVVPVDDVLAGVEQTYDIRGDNTGHTHTVTLTVDDFARLVDGSSVTVTSSTNGAVGSSHTHEVQLSCP